MISLASCSIITTWYHFCMTQSLYDCKVHLVFLQERRLENFAAEETEEARLPKINAMEKQTVDLLHLMQKHLIAAVIHRKSRKVI